MNAEKITSFTKLKAWQKAHALVLAVYKASADFPDNERFGLAAQVHRAGVSITSNIAEGFNRFSPADKAHFYQMALGSCAEVQSQLLIAKDLDYIKTDTFQELASASVEVHRMLNSLIKAVKEFV
ncbi:MAG: four helix bundle protein [Candidatus Saccharimonadales bacterium]